MLKNNIYDKTNIIDLQNNCIIITKDMFFENNDIEYIYNTHNLKYIEDCAFDNTRNLKYIELHNSINYIGKNSFDSTSISEIIIPSSLTKIQDETFIFCTKLKHVIFEKNSKLIEIGKCAFKHCIKLKYIKLPNTLKTIDENAFYSCINLQIVLIPKTIKIIKSNAFYNCKRLKYVIFY